MTEGKVLWVTTKTRTFEERIVLQRLESRSWMPIAWRSRAYSRVLSCIIQHLLLPAYVINSQRIRAVRVELWLGRRGWVFVPRINSCKRGRERFLLEAVPAIVFEYGVLFTVARSTLTSIYYMLADDFGRTLSFHFSRLYLSNVSEILIETIFVHL